MNRVFTIIRAHVKTWFRSKSTIFWTLLFPILLIVLFGAIFGNGSTKFDLYIQNQDLMASTPTQTSVGYISALNHTGAFNIQTVSPDLSNPLAYVKDDAQLHNRGQRLIVIPAGFATNITKNYPTGIQLYMDQSDQASAALYGIINAATTQFASSFQTQSLRLSVLQVPIVTHNIRYIDFFIPGVIGMTLLTSGVFGAVNTNGRYRELKIIKKLATTPLSKIEWILGMVGYQMFLAAISIAVILAFGRFVFGVTAVVDIYTVGLVIAAALLFPGIGMVLANFVIDPDGAEAAANAITFPMMFLAGTFWPTETMPAALKVISNVLPLTFINNGLRDAMIYLEPAQAFTNTIIALGLAAFFIVLGSLLMSWKEE